MKNAKIYNYERNCTKLGGKVYFFYSKQHSKLSFWDLRPLKACFGIKTDFRDKDQGESGSFQKPQGSEEPMDFKFFGFK